MRFGKLDDCHRARSSDRSNELSKKSDDIHFSIRIWFRTTSVYHVLLQRNKGENTERDIWKLNKPLYSTKKTGEIWGSLLDKRLNDWNLKNSEYDNRINFYAKGSEFIIISIVADDLAFSYNSPFLSQRFKSRNNATFHVRIFGWLIIFISWNLNYSDEGILINKS